MGSFHAPKACGPRNIPPGSAVVGCVAECAAGPCARTPCSLETVGDADCSDLHSTSTVTDGDSSEDRTLRLKSSPSAPESCPEAARLRDGVMEFGEECLPLYVVLEAQI